MEIRFVGYLYIYVKLINNELFEIYSVESNNKIGEFVHNGKCFEYTFDFLSTPPSPFEKDDIFLFLKNLLDKKEHEARLLII